MRRLYLFLFFIAPIALQAQDITGVWRGHFQDGPKNTRSMDFGDRYRFEVQIAEKGKLFEGVTYSYLSSIFYAKAAAAGTVNVLTGKVLLQEGKVLEVRNGFGTICVMTCFMQYTRSGNEEFLEGTYVSMNVRDSTNCGRGTILLKKELASDFYTEPFVFKRQNEIADSVKLAATLPPAARHSVGKTTAPAARPTAHTAPPTARASTTTPKPGTTRRTTPARPAGPPERNPQPMARVSVPKETMREPMSDSATGIGRKFPTIVPGVIKNRENPTVKTIVVHTSEVTLNIYDDGAIDHDTVSVYLDNRPVILHAMLTDRPLVVTIHLDESNDYHEVVMVADNEGEIPPNTSLMIVKAGDKEYKVNITSTEQKNAVIKFQYAK
jgi:riboflavin synthase